jgi:hypothetical protein
VFNHGNGTLDQGGGTNGNGQLDAGTLAPGILYQRRRWQ